MKRYLPYILVAAFAALSIAANVCANKVIQVGVFTTAAGCLFFPLTFIVRDMLHKSGGKKIAQTAVVVGVIMNLAFYACIAITSAVPGAEAVGAQSEFALVLMPGIFIIIGSAVAQYVAETIDGIVFHKVYAQGRRSILATVVSNAVSVPIDSVLFAVIGFGLVYPPNVIGAMIVGQMVIKYIATLVFTPLVKVIPVYDMKDAGLLPE